MMKLAVIVATKGRPQIVRSLVEYLREQTQPADLLVIAASDPRDVEGVERSGSLTLLTDAPAGSAHQRNAGLAAVPPSFDIVVFFDDDFLPSRSWLENARKIFERSPDIVSLTGEVLADGVKTPGIPWATGASIVAQADAEPHRSAAAPMIKEPYSPYGCNMAFSRRAVGDIRFDERLVLYGWQEDTDFGARVGHQGRAVWSNELWGVHLGAKGGRVRGTRLGYSQMVNPRYLVAKGVMSPRQATRLAAGNLAANAMRSFRPEPYIDRAGRLWGNLIGLCDILTGRWRPERAAEL